MTSGIHTINFTFKKNDTILPGFLLGMITTIDNKIKQLITEYKRINDVDAYIETIRMSLNEIEYNDVDDNDGLYIVTDNNNNVHHIRKNGPVIIGRSYNCDINILNVYVSRIHCILFVLSDIVLLYDFSRTGTHIVRRSLNMNNMFFDRKEKFTILLGLSKNPVFLSFSPYECVKDCIICCENKRCILLVCGHNTMCDQCYDKQCKIHNGYPPCIICRSTAQYPIARVAACETYNNKR